MAKDDANARWTAIKMQVVGALLFFGGVAAGLYYFQFFDTTVQTGFGRVHNLGLLADRQNGLIASGVVVVLGLILASTGSKRGRR